MSQKPIQEHLHAVAEDAKQKVITSRRPWYHVGKVARVLFGVYALLLVLFGSLAWLVHTSAVLPLDVTITHTLQQDRAPWLQAVMLVISFLGSALVLWPLILAARTLDADCVGVPEEAARLLVAVECHKPHENAV